jgi:transposase
MVSAASRGGAEARPVAAGPGVGAGAARTPVGLGTPRETLVFVASHFRRRVHQRETLSCGCGKHIVTAPCPDKVAERSPYFASFLSALVVQRCEAGIPRYRMEEQFDRLGIPIARSTMTDVFHRAATLLAPIARRILTRPTGRQRGAQPGHKGHKRVMLPPEKVTRRTAVRPSACACCGGGRVKASTLEARVRQARGGLRKVAARAVAK